MVAVKQKTVVTMKMGAACPSHSRTDISIRDVTTIVDEPEARGGTNKGPTPTETLLASLAGCTNVITQKIARARGVEILGMAVDIEAQFDRRGVQLEEEIAVPFPKIVQRIRLTTNASDEDVEMIKTDLEKFCPISKVIKGSGTEVINEWTISRG